MNKNQLLKYTQDEFRKHSSDSDRGRMVAYMKGHFDFYGLKAPKRKEIEKHIKKYGKSLTSGEIFEFAEDLWALPQRELQYTAIEMLTYNKKYWAASHLKRVEELLITKSWWDTVDALAPNIAGFIVSKDHELRKEWIERWNNSNNMWLNRSAIIHQLKYKHETNMEILFALVETHADSEEFFIRKASGWALRQASKFYPNEVRIFIEDHPELSTLTKREGSKYL